MHPLTPLNELLSSQRTFRVQASMLARVQGLRHLELRVGSNYVGDDTPFEENSLALLTKGV